MPFDCAYWPAAGLSTFWPSTSAPQRVDEALRRLLLLGGVVPRVRPDQLHLRLRVDAPARRARTRWRAGSPRGSRTGRCSRSSRSSSRRPRPCRRGRSSPHPRRSTRRGSSTDRSRRLLEVARPGTSPRAFLSMQPERRREDDLVAVADEARDRLGELRARRDVLLVGRLHLRAEHLLDVLPAVVVGLSTSRRPSSGRRRSTRP